MSLLISCGILNRGYYNENNQYRPKKPSYKLKNKAGLQIDKDLDLQNVYILREKYYKGNQYYPIDPFAEDPKHNPMHNIEMYIRFSDNGRCYSFSKKKFDAQNKPIPLVESDLDTKRAHLMKEYYYQHDYGLAIETFAPKEGTGDYLYKYCQLLEDGKRIKLTYDLSDPSSYDFYELLELPTHYKKPVIDW